MKRIRAEELQSGMIISRFDKSGVPYAYYGHPLPRHSFESVKRTLAEHGVHFIFIKPEPEPEATREEFAEELVHAMEEVITREPQKTFQYAGLEELLEAHRVHDHAKEITKSLLTEVRLGKAIQTDIAKGVVQELVANCFKNPEAFVNMTRLKDFDDYTFTHSVNVSALAISIGKRLGMNPSDLEILGMAALLHDVGKMKIPDEILNKDGKLTEEEFAIMKMHPVHSYEILKQDTSIPPEVITACLQHHEKSDGTGYPHGLTEKQISRYAKIIAISDVYDAITSDRCYHKGMIATDALKLLFSWSGKHFNEILVKFFINLIGIYPPGTIVMLDSGEIAVVLETNKKDSTRPKVVIFEDENKNRVPICFCDLSSYNAVTGKPYKTIISAIKARDIEVNPNDIISEFISTNTIGFKYEDSDTAENN